MTSIRCSVCEHTDREAIDLALSEGRSSVLLGERYQINERTLRRHGAHREERAADRELQRQVEKAWPQADPMPLARIAQLREAADHLIRAAAAGKTRGLREIISALETERRLVALQLEATGPSVERSAVLEAVMQTATEYIDPQHRGAYIAALEANLHAAGIR